MNRLAIHIPMPFSVLLPTVSAVAVLGCSADGELLVRYRARPMRLCTGHCGLAGFGPAARGGYGACL